MESTHGMVTRHSELSADQLDEEFGTNRPADSFIAVFFASSDPGYAGARLSEIDRELRRGPQLGPARIDLIGAEAVLADAGVAVHDGDGGLPRPLPSHRAGFRIIDADAGTFEVLLQAVGGLVDYLNSHPVTAIVNLAALWMVGKPIRITAAKGIRRVVRGSKRLTLAIARDLVRRLEDQPPIFDSRTGATDSPPATRLVLVHREESGLWTIVAVDVG